MGRQGNLQTTYTARGLPRYELEIWHDELDQYQVIRGKDIDEVYEKARVKLSQWDKRWERISSIENGKAHAEKETKKMKKNTNNLKNILKNRRKISWTESLNKESFPENEPSKPNLLNYPKDPKIPHEPKIEDDDYKPNLNILDHIFTFSKKKKIQNKEKQLKEDHKEWETKKKNIMEKHGNEVKEITRKRKEMMEYHELVIEKWKKRMWKFNKEKDSYNKMIRDIYEHYRNHELDYIEDYVNLILNESQYPFDFQNDFDLEYNPNSETLIVDYELPDLSVMPSLKELKFIQTRKEFTEIKMSENEINKLYDQVIYQIPLKTMEEIYNADEIEAIKSIVFNGFVTTINPATGKEAHGCIISIQTQREEFLEIDLDNVDPKKCFKGFKGIGSSKLHSITPVPPILTISREDKRFVEGYEVASELEEGYNVAAMDLLDFENLIRELFEKEFSKEGGEVKVTRSSRDGGVDAVAFDSDPIRGGKIVIQAKRYTNTVGVSAVRDLYGTVLNEGAMKGILITTADYGPDAYDFAKDKPLSLLNGGHLLHMLREHGHNVKIDLKEAKEILSENE